MSMFLELCFSCDEGASSQMEVWHWKNCFLSHCMMPSQAQTLRKAQLHALYIFGRGAQEYLAPLFYLHLAQIVVFLTACR